MIGKNMQKEEYGHKKFNNLVGSKQIEEWELHWTIYTHYLNNPDK